MHAGPRWTGRDGYLETSSTQDSQTMTAGHKLGASFDFEQYPLIHLGNSRGLRFGFVGDTEGDLTFDAHAWVVVPDRGEFGKDRPAAFEVFYWGKAACTAGAGEPTGEAAVGSNVVDTIAWTISAADTTPKGPGSAFQTALGLGTVGVFSPADDTPAYLLFPHVPGCAMFWEFVLGTASGANCWWEEAN